MRQRLDAGGLIPTWVMNKTVPRALSAAHSVIDYFRQDERIDAADMGELSDYVQEHWREEVYSEEENALLQRVRQKFEGSLEERKWITLKVRRRNEDRSDELAAASNPNLMLLLLVTSHVAVA